jgi:hypothetical protein
MGYTRAREGSTLANTKTCRYKIKLHVQPRGFEVCAASLRGTANTLSTHPYCNYFIP